MGRDKLEETLQVYEHYAHSYDAANMQRPHGLMNRFLEYIPGKRILDAGCGPGRDSAYFVDKGYQVTGIDLCDAFLAMARERAPQGSFHKMDMCDLGFAPDSFDGIWALASLLHVPKRQARKTLIGFSEVLSKNGTLFIGVKHGRGQRMERHPYGETGERFFTYYSASEIAKTVMKSGFDIREMSLGHERNIEWINLYAQRR